MRYNRYSRLPALPETIDLQSLGAELHIYGEIDDPMMRDFNPSLCWHKDKLKITIRRCNFDVERHGKWSFRLNSGFSLTEVLLGDLDPDTLKVKNITKLELSDNSPTDIKVAGLEDVRLHSHKGTLYATGFQSDRISKTLHNSSAGMAEYKILGNKLEYIRSLEKPVQGLVEKNWIAPDTPSKEFEYTYSPTQTWKDGKLQGEPYKGNIHGGTLLLKQKNGTYLSLVHDKITDPTLNRPHVYDKYVYYTYLAEHNEQGIITKMSKAFRFGTLENIEFASGMVEYEDDFIISLGIRDCKFALCRVSKSKLMDLMLQ